MGLETAAVAAPKAAEGAGLAKGAEGAAKGAEAAGALGAGGEAAMAGAPLDLLSFGSAAGTAPGMAIGEIAPATGAMASGLATEPGFASAALNSFAPGLDTSAAGLGLGGATPGGAAGVGGGAEAGAGVGQSVLPTGVGQAQQGGAAGLGALDNVAAGGTPLGASPGGTSASGVAGLPGTAGAASLDPTASALPAATSEAAKAGGAAGKGVLESLGIKSPLGAAIGAAGLGYNLMQGQQPAKFSPELQAQAARLDANGQKLMSYLESGNLPPGLKTSLDRATSDAKRAVISNFAKQGLSTDPKQNSVLAQQLAQIDQQAIITTAEMGQKLLNTGLQESGLSSDLYKTLANIDATQTANIGKSIANFASAISGSQGGVNLKLA